MKPKSVSEPKESLGWKVVRQALRGVTVAETPYIVDLKAFALLAMR